MSFSRTVRSLLAAGLATGLAAGLAVLAGAAGARPEGQEEGREEGIELAPAPELEPLLRPGAKLDSTRHSHRRPVEVPGSSRGLTRVPLTAEDLALARLDLGDLRLIDGEGRQWPFWLEPGDGFVTVELAVEGPELVDRSSHFRLVPAPGPLRPSWLELTIDAPFFDRPFRLEGEGEGGKGQLLREGRLSRRPGTPTEGPPRLALAPTGPLSSLTLIVADRDDAPLPLRKAEILVSAQDLFLLAPPGNYFLLLGDPELAPPHYEVAGWKDRILAVPAVTAGLGELTANPDRAWWRRWLGTGTPRPVILWPLLALAVIALVALTLRRVGQGSAP